MKDDRVPYPCGKEDCDVIEPHHHDGGGIASGLATKIVIDTKFDDNERDDLEVEMHEWGNISIMFVDSGGAYCSKWLTASDARELYGALALLLPRAEVLSS